MPSGVEHLAAALMDTDASHDIAAKMAVMSVSFPNGPPATPCERAIADAIRRRLHDGAD